VSDRDTIAVLATEIGSALEAAARAFRSPAAFAAFMERLGWDFAAVPPALEPLSLPAEQIAVTMGDGEVTTEETPQLLAALLGFFAALRSVPSQPAGSFPPGLDVAAFKSEFPRQLIDYLVADHLLRRQLGWGELLKLAGVLRLEDVAESATRPAFTRYTVAWEDLGRFLSDPALVLRNAYRWGQPDFRDATLVANAADLLDGWHIDYHFATPEPAIFDSLTAAPLDPDEVWPDALRVPFYEQAISGFGADVGLQLLILPETALELPGLAVVPYAAGDYEEDIVLSDDAAVEVRGNADFAGGVAIVIRPNRPVELEAGFGGGAPIASSAALSFGLVWRRPGESEIVLIGSPDGSRLRMASLALRVGGRLVSGGGHDLYAETEWIGAGLVIRPEPGEADSFLASLLPTDGAELDFNVTLGISTSQGVYFAGGGGLEITLPAHVQLGPVEIQSALLAVRPAAGAVPVTLAATVKGELGVVKAVVENVGLIATFTFPDDGNGNLGPIDLALAFRPPNGVGIAIDAGVMKGGGYLFFDQARGEYAGALELSAGFLSLKAIGLIDTKLPNGQAGFALLVIITAEFNPGLQLGFGFALTGVGGILGLNRVLLLEPLVAGVRTGAVNSVLFPRDVVANAPRILSDLRTFFPASQGTFLVGPMAKIGWGTPTLISISLGVIVEIPGNVVILGRLRVVLPTEEAAIVVLQVTFVGALEFERRRIWFFATLFESRVLSVTLDGEMGLLMDFGDQPEFLLSVGGFHPRFTAPPLPFPAPARLQLSIVNESFARVRAETYVAVTSNTVQLGCRAEAFFGFDAFSVEGQLSFDALLRFSPFYLIVEVSAGFSVKVFGAGVWGVHLRGSIEGPTPWRVRGSAEIDILFFSFDVDVDVTFGERRHDVLPPIEVLPRIQAEFEKLESWRATLPASGRLFVSLRDLGAADALVLHPVGTLQISQRFAPLNLPLDRIGQQKPSDVNLVRVTAESASLAVRGEVREKFAAAQYRDMDDAAKLSAPSFEPLEAGVELGAAGEAWTTGPLAQRNVRYEQIIVDTPPERPRKPFFEFPNGLFVHFRAGAAIHRSAVSLATERRLKPFADKVAVGADRYTFAFQADNRAASATATFESFAEAEAHLAGVVRADPNLADALHVIPGAEVNVVA
jgi:Family of unknown function (DUF6603)